MREFPLTSDPDVHASPPAPLLAPAVGLIGGIVIDDWLHAPMWAAAALLGAACLAYARPRIRPRSRRVVQAGRPNHNLAGADQAVRPRHVRHDYSGLIALLLAGMSVGMVRHAMADRWLAADHVFGVTPAEPSLMRLSGTVATVPTISEVAPGRALAYPVPPRTRFILNATGLAGDAGLVPVSGRVAVSINGAVLDLVAGDAVEMTGWLFRPGGPRNPGEFDWSLRQRRRGVHVGFSCSHPESVQVTHPPDAGPFRNILSKCRIRLRGYLLDDAFLPDDEESGVLSAMVLGGRSEVSDALNEAFVRSGNAHFLAASGLNVAWLALTGWGVMLLFGAHYRTTVVVVAAVILSFVVLAEPEPSILRAGVVGLLGCISVYLRGWPNTLNWLACAAGVVLLIDPSDVFRAAFQLSFLAVLAVMHLTPIVVNWLGRVAAVILPRVGLQAGPAYSALGDPYIASLIDAPTTVVGIIVYTVLRASRLAVAVSIAAWFVNIPLACYHFNQLSLFGWLGTLLLWIPAFATTLVGFLKLLLALVLPSSGMLFGPLLAFCTRWMVDWAVAMSKIPAAMLDGRGPSLAWVVCCYTLLAVRVYRPAWLKWRPATPIAATLLFLWWLMPPRWVRAEPGSLLVWMLAVGDGTATVVEMPDGGVLIYDFGTRSVFDAGQMGVQFLRSRGIDAVDTVIVSHADSDHLNAIATLSKTVALRRVMINDHFHGFCTPGSSGERFLENMKSLGIPVEVTHGPHRLARDGDVLVESIWPPALAKQRVLEPNESSTVLRLTYQGRTVLLTGDVAYFAMSRLLQDGGLDSDVLALPHHGSVVGNTAAFIRAVDPRITVRSSGQRTAMTVNGIEGLVGQRRYFNTADDGCVLVRIRDGRVTAEAVMMRE